MVEQVPVYRANLNSLIGEWFTQYGLGKYLDVAEITQSIEVVPFIRELSAALTGLFGKSLLVLIYVLFLLLEQTRFGHTVAKALHLEDIINFRVGLLDFDNFKNH